MLFIEVMSYASHFHLMFMVCIQHTYLLTLRWTKVKTFCFWTARYTKDLSFWTASFLCLRPSFFFFACHELINTIPFVISCFQIKLYRFCYHIDVFGIDSPNKFCWNTNGEGCKAFGNSYQNVRAFWDTYILHTKINGQ